MMRLPQTITFHFIPVDYGGGEGENLAKIEIETEYGFEEDENLEEYLDFLLRGLGYID